MPHPTAKTSVNTRRLPAVFNSSALGAIMQAVDIESIFDFGSGKEGAVDKWCADQGIEYLPFDPHNRDAATNAHSEMRVADLTICSNLLNLVEDLDACIKVLAYHTKKVALVTVYHNSALPRDRQMEGYIQRNWPPSEYAPRLEKQFDKVTKVGHVLVCSK